MKNQKHTYKVLNIGGRRIILLLLIVGVLSSCKKFVDIPPPTTQLVSASIFNNDASATAAQLNIYTQMVNNNESYFMALSNGFLSDELTNYSTVATLQEQYTNSMESISIGNQSPWNNAYNYIYQANAVLSGLQSTGGVSAAAKKQLTGEALFIRAFWHLYLANCFGAIPVVTSTNYTVNATLARTPQKDVYQQVINDLKQAQGMLSKNFVDASDSLSTTERVRPSYWAATSLLARAYLYTRDYKDAAEQSTIVINNNPMFSLVNDLNQVFKMNSAETIWSLQTPQPLNQGGSTIDGQFFILTGDPTGSGGNQNCSTISPQLMSSFEIGDQRKIDWIGSFSPDGVTNYYFPYKYKDGLGVSSVSEYTMVLRLAEQYLIRAEAQTQQNQTGNALTDLNTIRSRAGLANYAGATDQASLLMAILHERQVELFSEWGNRWFDLNRTGTVNSVMGSPGNVTQSKGGNWKSTDGLYPIPKSEILKDGKLSQNPGY